jgi:hypothetical protein
MEAKRRGVFLKVPFDQDYEPLFVALIGALAALGRMPHSVLEVPEQGEGRLARIFGLMRQCPVSIHDLSRVELPVRFNMPFELGIAFALSCLEKSHKFVLLEAKRHRLQKTLSDVNGIDPGIHHAAVRGVISCVLSHLGESRGNPDAKTVAGIHREPWKTIPSLKAIHGRANIYSRSIFTELVDGATRLAKNEGLVVN